MLFDQHYIFLLRKTNKLAVVELSDITKFVIIESFCEKRCHKLPMFGVILMRVKMSMLTAVTKQKGCNHVGCTPSAFLIIPKLYSVTVMDSIFTSSLGLSFVPGSVTSTAAMASTTSMPLVT